MDLFKSKYLMSKFVIEGLYRREVMEYPEEALREAITNAVIHRDYIGPAPIQIKIFNDRIWFWNEGRLPAGITIESLKVSHRSSPRNKLIADVFFKGDLIETWGRGTIKMVEVCRDADLPEPEFREESNGFSVWFYKDIYTRSYLREMGLNERQIRAMMFAKERGSITVSDFADIAPGVTKRTLQRDLSELTEKDLMTAVGERKARKYVLSYPPP